MRFRLSLTAKGVILVMVAMTLQLALMGWLGWLYNKAEDVAFKAEQSKKFVDDINKIERCGIDIYDTVDQTPKSEDRVLRGDFDDHLRQQIDTVRTCIKELMDLTAGSPEKAAIVAAAKESLETVFTELRNAQDLVQRGQAKKQ